MANSTTSAGLSTPVGGPDLFKFLRVVHDHAPWLHSCRYGDCDACRAQTGLATLACHVSLIGQSEESPAHAATVAAVGRPSPTPTCIRPAATGSPRPGA